MKNWKKILKNYLLGPKSLSSGFCDLDLSVAALPLFRAAKEGAAPLLAAFPDRADALAAAASLERLSRLSGIPLKILQMPECGRGKLLFPGAESLRARALDRLLHHKEYDVVVGSVHGLFGPAPSPDETRSAELLLKPGLEIPMQQLLQKLVRLDYDDEYQVSVTGEFARRGGIVDLFSPAEEVPCRVEFFGDVIESLRRFSPETQRSTGPLDEYQVIGRSGLTAGGAAEGDLFDYFPAEKFRFFCLYPALCRDKLLRYGRPRELRRFDEILEACCASGRALPCYDAADGAFHPEAAPPDALPPLLTETLPEPDDAAEEDGGPLAAGNLAVAAWVTRIQAWQREGGTTLLLAAAESGCRNLTAWAKACGAAAAGAETACGEAETGFLLPQAKLWVLTERDLIRIGYTRPARGTEELLPPEAPAEPQPPAAEFSLAELDAGDYCVHLDCGIGIYRGIKTLASGGSRREVLEIEYRDGQMLYVPLLNAFKVSRYLGAPGKVKLHKLGGSRWSGECDRARRSVRSYAADLLRLQAVRQTLPGIAYPKDTEETKIFLAAFPFTDTPDQKRATEEIRRDMERRRPMDRLLCGDVGYGKTEVAMRAVFKAVSNGFQAAVLAPTTVLAQQHFRTFKERFAAYPFTIEMLSRFRTPSEQRDVIRRAASGGIDVLIGTHRLCDPQLAFHNLGLVVIDEEQRFGVEHKERLRRFRAETDVLAMSATPIPRTLYLAMAGARDLSTLMTAPKERHPVRTVIAPEEMKLVVEAIQSELARGGQVYYLHNRVKTIDDKAARLAALLPGVRIGVAHGQMPEEKLDGVMTDFLERRIDCLVCSTIIESGMDVPNANTIIIERADRFGLAELYQLRGRVGRWKQQAYAYLLLPKDQLIGSDARKRLAAIRRCSNLGAGFQLALHDLEIRGAGNILGAEQSGHLEAIGFDLYCQLLTEEVRSLKGEKKEMLPEVELALDFLTFAIEAPADKLAAAIPPEYVSEERLRLDAYRRLSSQTSERGLADLADELADRYGPLPEQVRNLVAAMRLKILAARAHYTSLSYVEGKVLLRNPGGTVWRKEGVIPFIDPRNSPAMKLFHLEQLLRSLQTPEA